MGRLSLQHEPEAERAQRGGISGVLREAEAAEGEQGGEGQPAEVHGGAGRLMI